MKIIQLAIDIGRMDLAACALVLAAVRLNPGRSTAGEENPLKGDESDEKEKNRNRSTES